MDKAQINSVLSSEIQAKGLVLVSVSELSELTSLIGKLRMEVLSLKDRTSPLIIYNNQSIMDLLNIKDKVLKKYRDDGLLGYHRVGDKFWYTREDIDNFLKMTEVPAYSLSA